MTSILISKEKKLKTWMFFHDITGRELSEKLGISQQRISKMLKSETMPTIFHEKCVSLGFPVDLLPIPRDLPVGRKKKGIFPAEIKNDIEEKGKAAIINKEFDKEFDEFFEGGLYESTINNVKP